MRRFHSYGPVDCERHFCVPRRKLVNACVQHLVDDPEKGGHYFTIWAPRQSGKTWLMQEVKREIEARHSNRFRVGMMSMQGVLLETGKDPDKAFLEWAPVLFEDAFDLEIRPPRDWKDWRRLFSRKGGMTNAPLILFIDEFDSLPQPVIDNLVSLFRDLYLKRDRYLLHGLALIGVRAVLGVGSDRGSPFNVQRALHVPNFTRAETGELFLQYQEESGQMIEPAVVEAVHAATRGQPGLVCWFGELLTEKYNPGEEYPIGESDWDTVYHAALHIEWNNTVLNLVKKAKGSYRNMVTALFSSSEMQFKIDEEWCNYLYLNGIIDAETRRNDQDIRVSYCRFSSPFVQKRLFAALTDDLAPAEPGILPLEPLDDLSDVFEGEELNLPALLVRYKAYLHRLSETGINPWKGLLRRTDLHLTEAVGHFHLYAWLREAVGRWCVVSPEFPTGNGRVDLHLRCKGKEGVLEVKSYTDQLTFRASIDQAARYARSLRLPWITLALFVPVKDETVIDALSGDYERQGAMVAVSAIAWA